MGSKSRIVDGFLPTVLKDRKEGQLYIEPFGGGMNVICNVDGRRIANDIHTPLIEMWKKLVDGWIPNLYSKEEYEYIKHHRHEYEDYELGWVGFVCAYRGMYFCGFADEVRVSESRHANGQLAMRKNILAQVEKMKGVEFLNKPYYELEIPDNSIIYCDPPYKDTEEYAVKGFDHDRFWEWVRVKDNEGHSVFVSEYQAPDDFRSVWNKEILMLAGSKKVVRLEHLFKYGRFEWA